MSSRTFIDLGAEVHASSAAHGRPRRPCGRRTRRRASRSPRGTSRRRAAGRAASGVMPGSMTTKASKYSTRSISRSVMSSIRPMRDGSDFRNQMCAVGLASSMWPMRSRRTFGLRDLDAALLADDAAVLQALVLAAQALVVLDGPEDLGAEETVALRLERAVVDGLRLLALRRTTTTGSFPERRARSGSSRSPRPRSAA